MSDLRVFTFAPDWGLPSVGPFALKLLAWLKLAGIPYEQVIEGNPRKGPKGKNPWIELDGERIGDSEVIIDELKRRHGIDLDEALTPEQIALGHAWRRTFEEHFHQVLEWELFFHPAVGGLDASKFRFTGPGSTCQACVLRDAAAVWETAVRAGHRKARPRRDNPERAC